MSEPQLPGVLQSCEGGDQMQDTRERNQGPTLRAETSCSHFTDKETEAHESEVISPKSPRLVSSWVSNTERSTGAGVVLLAPLTLFCVFASSSLRPLPRPAQELHCQVGVPARGVSLAPLASFSPSFAWASPGVKRAQQGLQGEEVPTNKFVFSWKCRSQPAWKMPLGKQG